MRLITFLSGITGALLFAIASIVGGLQIEDYSFVSQYISESFATGVPNAAYLRYMYMASGLLLFVFGIFTPSFWPRSKGIRLGFFVFAVLYGLGNITVAVFPCDAGCPTGLENTSMAQLVHNASAFLTYIAVPWAIISIGFSAKKAMSTRSYPNISMVCGLIALVFVVLLFGSPKGAYIGIFQRIIEASILFWVVYTAIYIRRTNNRSI